MIDRIKKSGSKLSNLLFSLLVAGSVFVISAVPAVATPATVDDMWAAVDLTGISSKVIGVLIAVIGIKLVFVAARYIGSALARARG
jgi:hypothetical protein